MKVCFLIMISVLFLSFQDDKILWRETPLTWDDFKGKPNTNSPYKANTETETSVQIKTKDEVAIINLECSFVKNLSWSKDKNNPGLLLHEQMHFNISEINARKFRKKLKGKTFSVKTFQQELNKLHAEIKRESKTMQAEYDKETEHSVNTKAQEKWNRKIEADLKSLSEFSPSEISCKLSK